MLLSQKAQFQHFFSLIRWTISDFITTINIVVIYIIINSRISTLKWYPVRIKWVLKVCGKLIIHSSSQNKHTIVYILLPISEPKNQLVHRRFGLELYLCFPVKVSAKNEEKKFFPDVSRIQSMICSRSLSTQVRYKLSHTVILWNLHVHFYLLLCTCCLQLKL